MGELLSQVRVVTVVLHQHVHHPCDLQMCESKHIEVIGLSETLVSELAVSRKCLIVVQKGEIFRIDFGAWNIGCRRTVLVVCSTLCKNILGHLLAVNADMGHSEESELVDWAILFMLRKR